MKGILPVVLLISILYSYLKVECLTYRYPEEFRDKRIYQGYINELEYLKVFDYSGEKAKVYYDTKMKIRHAFRMKEE